MYPPGVSIQTMFMSGAEPTATPDPTAQAAGKGWELVSRDVTGPKKSFDYLSLGGTSPLLLQLQAQSVAPITYASAVLSTQISLGAGNIASNPTFGMSVLSCYQPGQGTQGNQAANLVDVFSGWTCYLSAVVNVGVCPGGDCYMFLQQWPCDACSV
jgi:hypothetical protein